MKKNKSKNRKRLIWQIAWSCEGTRHGLLIAAKDIKEALSLASKKLTKSNYNPGTSRLEIIYVGLF